MSVGTARVGSVLFICVLLLEEEETKLNWSAALHAVQRSGIAPLDM